MGSYVKGCAKIAAICSPLSCEKAYSPTIGLYWDSGLQKYFSQVSLNSGNFFKFIPVLIPTRSRIVATSSKAAFPARSP